MIATTTPKSWITTLKKEIQALGRFPYSTRYFCSMLQFYLVKIIKHSEFDYADFYYQRYLLNLPNYLQPFSWLKGSIRSVALCALLFKDNPYLCTEHNSRIHL